MTCVIRAGFFAFFLTTSLSSFSQQPDSLDSNAKLKEVVIQATRADARSAVPHSNFSAATIAKSLQAQDVPYLLTGVPSLVETSDAGTGIGYTGLRIRGSDPTRVNVTINGIPVNDAESQGMYWVDLPDLAASAAEIQVQRGVGGSTNGAGAFGATVNIDLSQINPLPSASVRSTIGSFGTRQLTAAAGTGLLHDKWVFTTRNSFVHSDGYIDRGSADLQSMHVSGAYIGNKQTLQFHFLNGREITYQAWNGVPEQYLTDNTLRHFNTAGQEQPGMPYADQVDHYTQRYYLLHYKRELPGGWMLQLNGNYTRGFGYYEQYRSGEKYAEYGLTPFVSGDTTITQTDLVRRLWLDNDFYGGSFALRHTASVHTENTWLIGGGFNRYQGDHYGEIIWTENPVGVPKNYRYYENAADKNDGNLFIKHEHRLAPGWNLSVDLQERAVTYDFLGYNEDLESTNQRVEHLFFNPKFGITYSKSINWMVYGFWGAGHREPNRDDYTQSSPASRPLAEKLSDSEAGFRYQNQDFSANLNLFYMEYKDQLVLDGSINEVGAYTRINVPDSYRAGLELEAKWRPTHQLQLSGNVAFSRNKIKEFTEFIDDWDTGGQLTRTYRNTDLAFSPALISRGDLNFILFERKTTTDKIKSVSLNLGGKYVSKQFLDNTSNEQAVLAGYFTGDLRVNALVPTRKGPDFNLIFSINNLFNQKYESNGWIYRFQSAGYDPRPDDPYSALESNSTYHLAGYFPQAGRNWALTLQARF